MSGTIVTRLPLELHQAFKAKARRLHGSMNRRVVALIQSDMSDPSDPSDTSDPPEPGWPLSEQREQGLLSAGGPVVGLQSADPLPPVTPAAVDGEGVFF